ncbi:glycine zipper family protein [Methylohalobius crimeensis]|uniref:glycine zipper family protein n=1 Tax=Methylohalobius crimeensis TaxID=244365 RepID=UPI0003F6A6D1|nr:glycine zipper family protein [Methylohalobius crimeensis]
MRLLMLLVLLIIAGCASYGNWQPTVDPYGDPRAAYIHQDQAECRQLASQASGGTAQETAKGALVGGALGAATGAVVGALAGAPGTGAAWGAGLAGMGGGIGKGLSAEERYKRVYRRCMQNRGHTVLD